MLWSLPVDAERFDTWARRRFGWAAGGALAALTSFGRDGAEARRKKGKKRKKRCRKLRQLCRLDGGKRCCAPMACAEETADPEVSACCRYIQTTCESDNQCCIGLRCRKAVESRGDRCCLPLDLAGCAEDADCCAGDGVTCDTATGNCCRQAQATCAASDECCGDLQCANVPALGSGLRCCAGDNESCQENEDCCFGMACINNVCVE
jgi:hypothetical protein